MRGWLQKGDEYVTFIIRWLIICALVLLIIRNVWVRIHYAFGWYIK